MQPNQLLAYVKDTGTAKGRGVFASRPIEPGELIELCPVIPITTPYPALPVELRLIVFNWQVLAQERGITALVLGYGSLYNHANPANARYKAGSDRQSLAISAVRRIEQDEEITINYNATAGEPTSVRDTWFAVTGVTPYVPPIEGAGNDG